MARTTVWTRYAEARQLNATFRGVAIAVQPGDWRVGLMTLKGGVDPAQIPGRDDVVEFSSVTFPDYARQPLGATTLTEPAGGVPQIAQDTQIQFPEAQSPWGLVAALGLFDSAGNLWGVIPSAVADRRDVRKGDRITVPASEIVVTGYVP